MATAKKAAKKGGAKKGGAKKAVKKAAPKKAAKKGAKPQFLVARKGTQLPVKGLAPRGIGKAAESLKQKGY